MGILKSSSQLAQKLDQKQRSNVSLVESNEELKRTNTRLEEQLDQKELSSLIVKQIVSEASQQPDPGSALNATAKAINEQFDNTTRYILDR